MGFLDKKTRIVDIHLTELGRQLFAQNQLVVAHYAFSDDLIDYSGSLSQSLAQSSSIDEVVYKNFIPVECTSMKYTSDAPDLQSFLYTCPEQRDSLPIFKPNVSGSLDLTRIFQNVSYQDFVNNGLSDPTNNSPYLIITQRDDTAEGDREAQYVAEQNLAELNQLDPDLVSLMKS